MTEHDRNSQDTDTVERKTALQEHAPTQPTVLKTEEADRTAGRAAGRPISGSP